MPETLRAAIDRVAEQALRSGALLPIRTHLQTLRDGDLEFQLRIVDSLVRKGAAKGGGNPFLPYEPALYVADVAPHHVLLLNKFNVLASHALLITRAFQPQTAALDVDDFAALSDCLRQVDALAFYNAGEVAGASQAHKHLQLVPLEAFGSASGPPLEAWLASKGPRGDSIWRLSQLPYAHAGVDLAMPPERGNAVELHAFYCRLLDAVDRSADRRACDYNLLMTRRWMLVVPRVAERAEGISINALGFAGVLLARDADRAERIRRATPSHLLRQVSGIGAPDAGARR